jgi:S1-C subfamily serine protease
MKDACMTCETLPIWHPKLNSPSNEDDCDSDAAARRIYQEVSNSVVEIKSKNEYGATGTASGFFVGNGDEIMTCAHVAADAGRAPLEIITKDGKDYTALIEAVDTVDDLAVLKLQGLAPGTYKPLQFRPSASLQIGEDMFMLGHPHGRSQVIIAPGQLEKRGTLIDLLDQDYQRKLQALMRSKDVQTSTQAKAQADAPRLESDANIERGDSGSPVVDSNGLVIGVGANYVRPALGYSASLEVPSELAINLLNPANHNRQFVYQISTIPPAHLGDAPTQQLRLVTDPVEVEKF